MLRGRKCMRPRPHQRGQGRNFWPRDQGYCEDLTSLFTNTSFLNYSHDSLVATASCADDSMARDCWLFRPKLSSWRWLRWESLAPESERRRAKSRLMRLRPFTWSLATFSDIASSWLNLDRYCVLSQLINTCTLIDQRGSLCKFMHSFE